MKHIDHEVYEKGEDIFDPMEIPSSDKEDPWIPMEDAYANMVSDLVISRVELIVGVGSLATGAYLLSQSLEGVAGYVASGIGSWLLYDCYKRVKR